MGREIFVYRYDTNQSGGYTSDSSFKVTITVAKTAGGDSELDFSGVVAVMYFNGVYVNKSGVGGSYGQPIHISSNGSIYFYTLDGGEGNTNTILGGHDESTFIGKKVNYHPPINPFFCIFI